jgi:cell division protein FtsQ
MNSKTKDILSLVTIITLIVLMVGYCIFALIYFDKSEQKIMCKQVVVCIEDSTTHRFVNTATIYDYLQKQQLYPIGKAIGIAEAHQIEQSIAKLSPIKAVDCYMGYNGNLHIDLCQRCPLYRIVPNQGKSYYVDNEQRIMPVSNLFTAYTPIVTGEVTKDMAQNELYHFMNYLLADNDWAALFAEVHVDSKQNIRLTCNQGVAYVELGKLTNYAQKLEKLRAWYHQYPHKNNPNLYQKITITYDELIFCTKTENHE